MYLQLPVLLALFDAIPDHQHHLQSDFLKDQPQRLLEEVTHLGGGIPICSYMVEAAGLAAAAAGGGDDAYLRVNGRTLLKESVARILKYPRGIP